MKAITFLAALEQYVNNLQTHSDDEFRQHYTNLWENGMQPKFEYTRGKRYIKILKVDPSSRAAFAFIDIENGDILKAAAYNAPAKGTRGNIFNGPAPLTGGELYR